MHLLKIQIPPVAPLLPPQDNFLNETLLYNSVEFVCGKETFHGFSDCQSITIQGSLEAFLQLNLAAKTRSGGKLGSGNIKDGTYVGKIQTNFILL